MSTHLHTVTITGTDEQPRIEFTCHGDRNSECHSYPDCECESWNRDDHPHPFAPHDECWMQPWFDNDCTSPMAETIDECEMKVGMSGPIEAEFADDYVEWTFLPPEVVEQTCVAMILPIEETR
ncbi:hypothetical protein [Prescottella equi]|uniref:hypothetical protein n=1 Tax=Rhodococcus hoagii TaxID=43767 RepID=UPI000A0F7AA2|nr:hypothetical protein [Prescottella equi]